MGAVGERDAWSGGRGGLSHSCYRKRTGNTQERQMVMVEYMLFIYERNQDFRQTLYAVPPQIKKKPPMSVHIHTRIHTHTHTLHTHAAHAHTHPQHSSRCHAFKQLHISTLFPPVMTISTGRILAQLQHEEETLCMASSAPWNRACLFIFLSLWEKHQSPKVLQHQGRASSPHCWHPAAPWPVPPPRHPCLGVGRQWPAQDNVKKATHTHTHPPTQIIK